MYDREKVYMLQHFNPVYTTFPRETDKLVKTVEASSKLIAPLTVYTDCMANVEFSKKTALPQAGLEVPRLFDELEEDLINNTQFYDECLHGRITHPFFYSDYPECSEKLWHICHCAQQKGEKNSKDGYFCGQDGVRFGDGSDFLTACLYSLRNRTILKKWDKFRKVYIFDKLLEESFATMGEDVQFPAVMVDRLPFNTLYIKFQDGTAISDYFDGVFIDIHKASGLISLEQRVEQALKMGVQAIALESVKNSSYKKELQELIEQKEKAVEDFEKVNDYVSVHMLFISKESPDEIANYTMYSHFMTLGIDENGNCLMKEEKLKRLLKKGDFYRRATVRKMIIMCMNALMYLGATNADIVKKTISQPKFYDKKHLEEKVEVNECGYIWGADVRAFKKAQQEKGDGIDIDNIPSEHTTRERKFAPMPHPVGAHYQGYWTGKGRKIYQWTLKHPYYRGGRKFNNRPVNVSRVVNSSETDGSDE